MAVTILNGGKGRRKAVVDGNLTIYEAAANKPVLLSALAKAKELEVDLSSVREMDTAGLQLLALLKRESLRAGTVMRLVGHSPASREVFDTYNVTAYFAAGATSPPKPTKHLRPF